MDSSFNHSELHHLQITAITTILRSNKMQT